MAHADQPGHGRSVAVIGTGIMGSAIARNLLAAGFRTSVWDRSPASVEPLVAAGAIGAGSAREAVQDADVVITMLATHEAINSVIFDQGTIDAFAQDCVWAQMATIGVEETLEIARRVAGQRTDVAFVDAPVSGTKGPADRGELSILASGPEPAQKVLAPIFSVLGRKTVWLGEAGQGTRMKMVLNAYLAILIEGVAEAAELADRLGVEHRQLAAAVEGGPLAAPLALAKLRKIDEHDYEPEFPLQWALKDVDLALEASRGDSLPVLTALSRQWHAAVSQGHGREDVSAARLALGDDS